MVTTGDDGMVAEEDRPNADLDRSDRLDKVWRIVLFLVVAVILLGGYVLWDAARSSNRQTQGLAQQVAAACADPTRKAELADLCQRAENIVADGEAVPGPKGEPGPPGANGRDGVDGVDGAPGAAGAPGRNGRDGGDGPPGLNGENGAQGAPGASGANGADGEPGIPGPEGPAGPPGPAGQDGKDGTDGEDGRGVQSVECVDDDTDAGSHWVITYTDGTTQDSEGPCRSQRGPLGLNP